jgi:hypothetical protein
LQGRGCRGHDVHAHFQAYPAHAQRLAHAVLAIDPVFLRQHVHHVPVHRQGDGARQLKHLGHVAGAHFLVLDGHRAGGIHALDVSARDPHVHL